MELSISGNKPRAHLEIRFWIRNEITSVQVGIGSCKLSLGFQTKSTLE